MNKKADSCWIQAIIGFLITRMKQRKFNFEVRVIYYETFNR